MYYTASKLTEVGQGHFRKPRVLSLLYSLRIDPYVRKPRVLSPLCCLRTQVEGTITTKGIKVVISGKYKNLNKITKI